MLGDAGFVNRMKGEVSQFASDVRKVFPPLNNKGFLNYKFLNKESNTIQTMGEDYPLYGKKANKGVFSKLKEPMTKEHVTMICQDGGIDYSGIEIRIIDDPELVGSGFLGYTHPGGGIVELYPDAFKNRETLVKTLGHERVHVTQNRLYGPPQDSITCGIFEDEARKSEDGWWNNYIMLRGGV